MNEWAFVIAAYGLGGLAVCSLVGFSYRGMRKAEADAEAAKPRR